MEKLTWEEWETFEGLYCRVCALATADAGPFQWTAFTLGGTEIHLWDHADEALDERVVDANRFIHDHERDRRELIESLRQQIADAGEAGEGLVVADSEEMRGA